MITDSDESSCAAAGAASWFPLECHNGKKRVYEHKNAPHKCMVSHYNTSIVRRIQTMVEELYNWYSQSFSLSSAGKVTKQLTLSQDVATHLRDSHHFYF